MAWVAICSGKPIVPADVHDTAHGTFDFERTMFDAAQSLHGEVPADLELLDVEGHWADEHLTFEGNELAVAGLTAATSES